MMGRLKKQKRSEDNGKEHLTCFSYTRLGPMGIQPPPDPVPGGTSLLLSIKDCILTSTWVRIVDGIWEAHNKH